MKDRAELARRGQNAFERGNYRRAARQLKAALESGDTSVVSMLAQGYCKLGNFDEAETVLRADWNRGQMQSGMALLALLEDLGEGDRAFQLSSELAGHEDEYGKILYAWNLYKRGSKPDALTQAKSILRELASRPGEIGDAAAGTLGVWEHSEGNVDVAEPLLRRGVDVYELSRTALAELLIARGDDEEAIQLLRVGVDAGETDGIVFYTNQLVRIGETDRAIELLRLEADAGDTNAAWNLYQLIRDRPHSSAEARRYLRQAIKGGDKFALELVESRRRKIRRKNE